MNASEKRAGNREIAFTILALIGIFGGILYFASVPRLSNHQLLGHPAPALDFQMPSGKQTPLEKEKGTAILINFWAGWCEPCLEEMPSLRMMESHFKGRPFLLLAFNIDEGSDNIRGTLPGKLPSHVIYNFSRSSLREYGVQYIPISVLVDRAGIVRKVYRGPRNWMDLEILQDIEELLR
jgi:thiol-disulfide isomerase/thioredoxin